MPLHSEIARATIDANPEGAVTLLGRQVGRFISDVLHPVQAARLLPYFMKHRQAQYGQQQMRQQQPEAQVDPKAVLRPPSVQFMSQTRARDLLLAAGQRIKAPEGIVPLTPTESAALFACFPAKQARQAMGPTDPQRPPRITPDAQKRLRDVLGGLYGRGAFAACGTAVAAGADIAHAPGSKVVQHAAISGRLAALLPALRAGGASPEDIMSPDEDGSTAMHWVFEGGDPRGLDALRGVGVSMTQLMQPDASGRGPLDYAAGRGKPEWVDAFLGAGLEPAALAEPNGAGNYLVQTAAANGHAGFVRTLGRHLEPGRLMPRDQHGMTPLHLAVNRHAGAPTPVEQRGGRQMAEAAAIDTLFELGVPREEALVQDAHGFTAFHLCAEDGHLPGLRSLWHPSLAPEAVMSGAGPTRSTPAHTASSQNQPGVVRFLHQEAHIPLPLLLRPTTLGNSPIHIACEEGHVDMVTAWAQAGAGREDFTRRNQAGQTPYDLARANGYGDAIKAALMQAGVPEWALVPLPASPVAGAAPGALPGPAQGPAL